MSLTKIIPYFTFIYYKKIQHSIITTDNIESSAVTITIKTTVFI